MNKFNYEIYDYSKVGVPKERCYIAQQYTIYEWDALKKHLGDNVLSTIFENYRKSYYGGNIFHKISPNYELEIRLFTPDGIYSKVISKFYETSGKKK